MGCSAVHVFETHLRHPVLVRTCRHTIHANHGMLIASVEEIGFLPSFLIGSETKICSFPSWSKAFPSHFFTPSFELFIKWPRSWKDPKGCMLQGPPNYRCNHGMDMNFGVFFRHWSMRKDDQRKFWVEHVRVRQEWCHTPTHVFRIRIEFCTIHMQHYRDHTFGVWLDKIKTSRNCEPFGCTVFLQNTPPPPPPPKTFYHHHHHSKTCLGQTFQPGHGQSCWDLWGGDGFSTHPKWGSAPKTLQCFYCFDDPS